MYLSPWKPPPRILEAKFRMKGLAATTRRMLALLHGGALLNAQSDPD
jgi:hypothetical protein